MLFKMVILNIEYLKLVSEHYKTNISPLNNTVLFKTVVVNVEYLKLVSQHYKTIISPLHSTMLFKTVILDTNNCTMLLSNWTIIVIFITNLKGKHFSLNIIKRFFLMADYSFERRRI